MEHTRIVDRSDWPAMTCLTLVWIAVVLLVDPRGDFPLIDDWSYGRAVKALVEQHRLSYDGWNNPTLFVQVLWGALFCLPGGFSFEALRYSTLVAGLAGGLATYVLVRAVSDKRQLAVVAALVLMLNPVYVQYAFTFMTDVPFTALATLAAVYFVRALRTSESRGVVLGTFFAAAATLVRQLGVALPIGYGLAALARRGVARRVVWSVVASVVTVWALLAIYNLVIGSLGLTPAMSGALERATLLRMRSIGMGGLTLEAAKRAVWAAAYLSLFLVPLLLVLVGQHSRGHALRLRRSIPLALGCAALFGVLVTRNLPPYAPLPVFSMAPLGMLGTASWAEGPAWLRISLSTLSLAALSVAVFMCLSAVLRNVERGVRARSIEIAVLVFALATSFAWIAAMSLTGFMERYLLPLVPLLSLAIAVLASGRDYTTSRAARLVIGLAIVGVLVFEGTLGVAYAHDLLAVNRARWHAVDYLVRQSGIAPRDIDGGFAVNGWLLFHVDPETRSRYLSWWMSSHGSSRPPGWLDPTQPAAFWRNPQARYVIELGRGKVCAAAEGVHSLVWTEQYTGWLPGASGHVAVCSVSSDDRTVHAVPTAPHQFIQAPNSPSTP